jgi:hypothetical protein
MKFFLAIGASMSTLHLYCDLREPSLSRAAHEARRLPRYALNITHARSTTLAENLRQLFAAMGDDDLGVISLLYAPGEQLKEASVMVAGLSRDLRGRITLSCSPYAPALRGWAEAIGLNYEDNCYEAQRRKPWKSPAATWRS